jgi:hypothetical protein
MANVFPKQVKAEIVDNWITESANWKVALLDSGFVYDHTTDDLYTDVAGDELPNGNGYTTTGKSIGACTGGYVNTYDYYLDAPNTAWTGATFVNVRYVVVYEDTADKIRFIFDLGANYSCTNSTFTVVWSTTPLGLITLTS